MTQRSAGINGQFMHEMGGVRSSSVRDEAGTETKAEPSKESLSLLAVLFWRIYSGLESDDRLKDLVKLWNISEYHSRHCFVVISQTLNHSIMRGQCEGSGRRAGEVKIWPIKEHACMSHTIAAHVEIRNKSLTT